MGLFRWIKRTVASEVEDKLADVFCENPPTNLTVTIEDNEIAFYAVVGG
jgi:hypothetical protein